jgi:hypothetical protein
MFFQKNQRKTKSTSQKCWNTRNWYYYSPKTGGKCDRRYRAHKPADCEGRAHIFEKKRKVAVEKDSDCKLKLANISLPKSPNSSK